MVPWVGLWCVVVQFPGYSQLLLDIDQSEKNRDSDICPLDKGLLDFILYVPVNNFSVMSRRVFLG